MFPKFNNSRKKIIGGFIFYSFSLYTLYQLLFKIPAIINGDGFEYYLMTESFGNHFTPELKQVDVINFKEKLQNQKILDDWNSHYLNLINNSFISDSTFLSNTAGYYTDLKKHKYSYHFWLYSLLSVPIAKFAYLCNIEITKIHLIMNWLFVVLTGSYLLFICRLSFERSILILLFYLFSSVYWFLFWSGPDVFAASLCLLSFVMFYEKKYYLGTLAASLGSMHFPPLFLVAIFIAFRGLIENKINFKNITLLFLCGIPIIIPSLFYLYFFHIPNLIVDSGYLDPENFSFTRLFGVFFDLNQGIFLSLPILIFIFFSIYFQRLIVIKKWSYDLLIFPVMLGMVFFFINMTLWNLGIMVIRYGVWCFMPIIPFAIMNLNYDKLKIKLLIFFALLIQTLNVYDAFGIFGMGGVNINPNQANGHNNLAKWVLSNYPSCYNPDPVIFGRRTLWGKQFGPSDSPIRFYNEQGKLTKEMIHVTKINDMLKEKCDLKKLKRLNYINGWAYINY